MRYNKFGVLFCAFCFLHLWMKRWCVDTHDFLYHPRPRDCDASACGPDSGDDAGRSGFGEHFFQSIYLREVVGTVL